MRLRSAGCMRPCSRIRLKEYRWLQWLGMIIGFAGAFTRVSVDIIRLRIGGRFLVYTTKTYVGDTRKYWRESFFFFGCRGSDEDGCVGSWFLPMYTVTGAQSRSDYSVNVNSFISVLVKLLCFVSGTVEYFDVGLLFFFCMRDLRMHLRTN